MTIKEQLIQEIESVPESVLAETLDFLRFLKTKLSQTQVATHPYGQVHVESNCRSTSNSTTPIEVSPDEVQLQTTEADPIIRGSTAGDLLKFAGTWQGDDFEECLQLVYDTRSQTKF